MPLCCPSAHKPPNRVFSLSSFPLSGLAGTGEVVNHMVALVYTLEPANVVSIGLIYKPEPMLLAL